jgi:hypothetical protein
MTITDNIFYSQSTAAISVDAADTSGLLDGNDYFDCAADLAGTHVWRNVGGVAGKGPNALAIDPSFADAANKDFTVGAAGLKNVGHAWADLDTLYGADVTSGFDIGVLQSQ